MLHGKVPILLDIKYVLRFAIPQASSPLWCPPCHPCHPCHLPPQVLHLENHRPAAHEGDIVIGAPLPQIQPTQPILAPTRSWHEIREIRENMGDELSTRRVQASSRRMISQWVGFGKPKPLRCNFNRQSPEGFEPHLNHNDKPSVVRSHAFFGAREL